MLATTLPRWGTRWEDVRFSRAGCMPTQDVVLPFKANGNICHFPSIGKLCTLLLPGLPCMHAYDMLLANISYTDNHFNTLPRPWLACHGQAGVYTLVWTPCKATLCLGSHCCHPPRRSTAIVEGDKDSEPRQREKCKACAQRRGWKVMAAFQGPCPLRYPCNDCRPGFNDCIPGCFKYGITQIVVKTGLEWLEEACTTRISTESTTQLSEPSAALARNSCFAPPPTYSPQPRPIELHGSTRGDTF